MAKATKNDGPDLVKNGKLTRAGMEDAIRKGGSVQLPDGRTITKLADLPTEVELAKGDPEAEKQVAADLQRQIRELNAQVKELQAGQTAPAAPTGDQGTGTSQA